MTAEAMAAAMDVPVPGAPRWILACLGNVASDYRGVWVIPNDKPWLVQRTGLSIEEVEAWWFWLRVKGYIREMFEDEQWVFSPQPWPHDLQPEPLGRAAPLPEHERRLASARLRALVLERDEYQCVICGSGDDLAIDHIVPFSKGGLTVEANLQTLCRSCNTRKGATLS